MRNNIKILFAIYFGFSVMICFLLLYPLFLITLSTPKLYRQAHSLRKFWGWWLFITGFIRIKQIKEQPINKDLAYVITPNHTSKLDIVSLTIKIPLYFNFMAKIELARVPVFGIFFRTIDIAVDRKNALHAAKAYQKAKDQLTYYKQSIVIFPEGTIPSNTPKLNKFKDGAFKMAIESQTPILPVTIINNWNILPDQGKFHFFPGKCIQYIHTPIPTIGLTENDIPALKEKVFNLIQNKLAEYGYFE
jgi:1-acyl-sn-glycerol-3-phosphate acyltransferase